MNIVFYNSEQMISHANITDSSGFHMVKKRVKIYPMVSPECDAKHSVALLFFVQYILRVSVDVSRIVYRYSFLFG